MGFLNGTAYECPYCGEVLGYWQVFVKHLVKEHGLSYKKAREMAVAK